MYPEKLKIKENYDIVVCGGGFAGFSAAYSAAREGAKVLIIDKNGCLGGVGTAGLVNHILGARLILDDKIYQSVGGLYKTLEQRLVTKGFAVDYKKVDLILNPHGWYPSLGIGVVFDGEYIKLELEQMLFEVGCEILYYTHIIDVVSENEQVSGVVVNNKSGTYVIGGKYFVDATGDADICRAFGLNFKKGDEDGGMAAASLEMHVDGVDSAVLSEYMKTTGDLRFKNIISQLKQNGEWTFDYDIFISVMLCENDKFMINTIRQTGVDGTDARSLSKAVIDGRKENYKLLDIMKKHFPGFKNAKIYKIAPSVGIRETVRIDGEYTLTVDDLINGTMFDDVIAMSSYGWDLPHPKKPSFQPFLGIQKKLPYTFIPYRCLVPKNSHNIIVAGRCISVEREVLGPIRVMAPCIAMGEAAGIAAYMSMIDNVDFKDINVSELKQKVSKYGGITDLSEIKEG